MSYILEALKKSQQERDLGQVPTLETLPTLAEADAVRINYWGVAAVALAGLAVVIALYAALRGAPEIPELSLPLPTAVVPEQPVPSQPTAVAEPSSGTPLRESTPEAPAQVGRDLIDPVDLRKDDTPKDVAVPPRPAPPPEPEPASAPAPAPAPALAPAPKPAPKSSRSASAPKKPEVPEDLRRDIEAFKEEVRKTQGVKPKKVKTVRPQDLELPRDVEKRLPGFLMTVHIYDPDPAKRFVLINARKLREGDQTREDMLVEEVLPDGVVLSWEGHRFFRHR